MTDDAVEENPVADFFEKLQMEWLAKNAGTPSVATRIPTVDEIIGLTTDADVLLKHDDQMEHVEGKATSHKRDLSKASSGPGQVRLEKTVFDGGETWLSGFDHQGEEMFSRLYVEEVEA